MKGTRATRSNRLVTLVLCTAVFLVAANLWSGAWADPVTVPPAGKHVIATAYIPAIPATEGIPLLTIEVDGEKHSVAIPSQEGHPASQMTIDFQAGIGEATLQTPDPVIANCPSPQTGTILSFTGLQGSGSGFMTATLTTTGLPPVSTPALPVSDLSKGVNVTATLCVEETGDGNSLPLEQPNSPPSVQPQSATTDEDVEKTITLSASDANNDNLKFSNFSSPTKGTLSVDDDGPTCASSSGTSTCTLDVTYVPAPNVSGSDSFTYEVSDGSSTTTTGTVSIGIAPINDAPVAEDVTAATAKNNTVKINLKATDVDDDTVSFVVLSPPAQGTVGTIGPVVCSSSISNGVTTRTCTASVDYSPKRGFSGTDSFTYQTWDGAANSNSATVSVVVSKTARGN